VGDGAAERGVGGAIRIDVNELAILRDVGETVDPILIDKDPVGDADLRPYFRLDILKAGQRH